MHRIFVVEDHPLLRKTLCQLVEGEPDLTISGYAPDIATTLQELTHFTPDLVLLDLSLPDGNGLDLLKELRVIHPTLPVVILTGHHPRMYRARALQDGAAAYVDKLDIGEKLLPTIRTVLNQ